MFCAEQAERDGLQFFWVDTCCIDKSNAFELTAAINSMFRWYRDAAKCYVYLADVTADPSVGADAQPWEKAFRRSRWFTRGWMLQELLAPRSVEFFDCTGGRLGDKYSLMTLIYKFTDIEDDAFDGRSLSKFSLDERMSWIQNRKTTRGEDLAYPLFGLFNVSMAINYGEGVENALLRLETKS
jgi:hypothetical protein